MGRALPPLTHHASRRWNTAVKVKDDITAKESPSSEVSVAGSQTSDLEVEDPTLGYEAAEENALRAAYALERQGLDEEGLAPDPDAYYYYHTWGHGGWRAVVATLQIQRYLRARWLEGSSTC